MCAGTIFPDATVSFASSGAVKFTGAQYARLKTEPLRVAIAAAARGRASAVPAGRPGVQTGSRFARVHEASGTCRKSPSGALGNEETVPAVTPSPKSPPNASLGPNTCGARATSATGGEQSGR